MAGVCVSLTTQSCVTSFSDKTFLIVCAGQQKTETSNGRSNYEGFRDMLAMPERHRCACIYVH